MFWSGKASETVIDRRGECQQTEEPNKNFKFQLEMVFSVVLVYDFDVRAILAVCRQEHVGVSEQNTRPLF